MKALSDYLHSKGLLFGMYADVGSATCGGYSGLDMVRTYILLVTYAFPQKRVVFWTGVLTWFGVRWGKKQNVLTARLRYPLLLC
jgi:hypothetical protein